MNKADYKNAIRAYKKIEEQPCRKTIHALINIRSHNYIPTIHPYEKMGGDVLILLGGIRKGELTWNGDVLCYLKSKYFEEVSSPNYSRFRIRRTRDNKEEMLMDLPF